MCPDAGKPLKVPVAASDQSGMNATATLERLTGRKAPTTTPRLPVRGLADDIAFEAALWAAYTEATAVLNRH